MTSSTFSTLLSLPILLWIDCSLEGVRGFAKLEWVATGGPGMKAWMELSYECSVWIIDGWEGMPDIPVMVPVTGIDSTCLTKVCGKSFLISEAGCISSSNITGGNGVAFLSDVFIYDGGRIAEEFGVDLRDGECTEGVDFWETLTIEGTLWWIISEGCIRTRGLRIGFESGGPMKTGVRLLWTTALPVGIAGNDDGLWPAAVGVFVLTKFCPATSIFMDYLGFD